MPEEENALVPVRSTRSRDTANEWALVLVAEGLRCRVQGGRGQWSVEVPELDLRSAREFLETYEEENPPPPPVEKAVDHGFSSAGVVCVAGLVAFFLVTGPRNAEVDWFARGASNAEQILAGEVWRVVTALTLHADWLHLFSNVLSGAFFFTAVFWSLGPGVGGVAILAAGALGNFWNAHFHGMGHSSVGASTAIFGAVGILCGLGIIERRRRGWRRMRAWAPLGAGLGIFAMLGTGEQTDVSAHFFGFAAGVGFGALASFGVRRQIGTPTQLSLIAIAIAFVVQSWTWALR